MEDDSLFVSMRNLAVYNSAVTKQGFWAIRNNKYYLYNGMCWYYHTEDKALYFWEFKKCDIITDSVLTQISSDMLKKAFDSKFINHGKK